VLIKSVQVDYSPDPACHGNNRACADERRWILWQKKLKKAGVRPEGVRVKVKVKVKNHYCWRWLIVDVVKTASKMSNNVIVSFSGGKDSVVLLPPLF